MGILLFVLYKILKIYNKGFQIYMLENIPINLLRYTQLPYMKSIAYKLSKSY